MKNTFVALLLWLSIINVSFGQGFNASGIGMAGAYGASARGVDALAWNPANLSLKHDNLLEINLVGVNFSASNSSLSINDYKRYFTQSGHGGLWTEEDIDNLLRLIPAGGLRTQGDIKGNVIGLMFGRYGFSVQMIGKILGVVPKSVFELFLKGNQQLFKRFSFYDTDASGFSAVKLSLSLSQPIPFKKYFDEFGVGMNINYYRGFLNGEVIESDGSFVTTHSGLVSTMNITSRSAEGGSGFGFDIGAAGRINKDWTVSLALNNVYASIDWSQNPEGRLATIIQDTIAVGDFENLDSLITTETYAIDAYQTRIPVVFHLGVAYDLRENVTLGLDLEQAFQRKMGYSDRGQLAIGVEYKPIGFLPLRAGMSFGGKWKYLFGMGFGLHLGFFQFDMGYAIHQGLWPTVSTGFSTAANIKIVF